MDVDTAVESKWVKIYPLSLRVREMHIMELLESADLKLANPSRTSITITPCSESINKCRIKLDSVEAAKKFVESFDGFKMKMNGADPLKVNIVRPTHMFKVGKSKRLKITNLQHDTSEQQLVEHIRKHCEELPQSLDIRRSSRNNKCPSFAFVQMQNLKDAKKAMETVQMTLLNGKRMWVQQWYLQEQVQQYYHLEQERYEYLEGHHSKDTVVMVILANLPTNVTSGKIKKMCTKFGTVERVRMLEDRQGFPMRKAIVTMEKTKDADKIFNELHGQKVGNCTITTHFKRPKEESRARRAMKKENLKKLLLSKAVSVKMSKKSKGEDKVYGPKKKKNYRKKISKRESGRKNTFKSE